MARTSIFKTYRAAYPVHVRVTVPPNGWGTSLDRMHAWARETLGHGAMRHVPDGHHSALLFRTVADAAALLAAFPGVEVADLTGRLPSAPEGYGRPH